MKLRSMLLLLISIPLLGFASLAAIEIWHKLAVVRQTAGLETLAGFSVRVGNLVHELQKERGLSSGFLSSQGTKFAPELKAQHALTDTRLAEFRKGGQGLDTERFAAFQELLGKIRAGLDALPGKRTAISGQHIPVPEAMGYYSASIATLLRFPADVSVVAGDADLARLAATYVDLLQAKERAGIERATLTGVFSVDSFTPEFFTRFVAVSSAQDVYINAFKARASDAVRRFFEETVRGESVDAVAQMKQQALAGAAEPSLGIDPQVWFQQATVRINLLKQVEDRLSADLIGHAGEIHSSTAKGVWIYLLVTTLAIVLTGLIAVYLIRVILRQLGSEPRHLAEIANHIAHGDLKVHIDMTHVDNASALASLRSMRNQLRELVGKIAAGAGQLAVASERMTGRVRQVSAGSDQQSEAAVSMAAAVEQLTVSINSIADNAEVAQTTAQGAGKATDMGMQAVGRVIEEMGQISQVVSETAQEIARLANQTNQITSIVHVIKEIADQTNLLALNAAIEAARAGEQGRGFAVVADEVRKLAERTSASTQEIEEMVNTIQRDTEQAIHSIETGRQRVTQGEHLAGEAGATMQEVLAGIHRALQAVNDISLALREQGSAANLVSGNVEKVAQMTEENSMAIRDLNQATDDLSRLAADLNAAVGQFSL